MPFRGTALWSDPDWRNTDFTRPDVTSKHRVRICKTPDEANETTSPFVCRVIHSSDPYHPLCGAFEHLLELSPGYACGQCRRSYSPKVFSVGTRASSPRFYWSADRILYFLQSRVHRIRHLRGLLRSEDCLASDHSQGIHRLGLYHQTEHRWCW